MKKTLCIYCTRTQLTKNVMESMAKELDAELVQFTDGKDYSGVMGYLKACVVALKKELPALKPFSTERPLSEYETVIVGFPTWVEGPSPLVKAFLKAHSKELTGKLCYVMTHMSPLPYDKSLAKLEAFAQRKPDSTLSVQTKKNDWHSEVKAFADQIR